MDFRVILRERKPEETRLLLETLSGTDFKTKSQSFSTQRKSPVT